MANEWNVSYPLDHTLISAVPGEIRKLKTSVKTQLDREHETPVDGDATGSESSSGSGVAYEGTSTPTNRPDGATALANNAIDRGRLWINDNVDPPVLERWAGAAFEKLSVNLSAYAVNDSDSTAMLKAHAYLATTAGIVNAFVVIHESAHHHINGYVGATDDPAGAGVMIDSDFGHSLNYRVGVSFFVAEGEYFEITTGSTNAVTILWKSFGALGNPVDQD